MSETQAMQQYSGFEMDDALELDEEMNRSFSGEWMKLKAGKNVVRFLPASAGSKPFKLVWEHQLNLPNGDFRNFACPKNMAKKACIICRKADQLKTTGENVDYERAKELFPKRRIYANVIDRAEPEVGPKILAFGKKIWEQLNEIRKDEDFGGDFTNKDTGFDVVIKRKGSGKNDTEYLCKATRQSELGNDGWLEQLHSLDRFAQILTEQQIRDKLSGDNKSDGGKADADAGSTVVDATFDEVGDEKDPF